MRKDIEVLLVAFDVLKCCVKILDAKLEGLPVERASVEGSKYGWFTSKSHPLRKRDNPKQRVSASIIKSAPKPVFKRFFR